MTLRQLLETTPLYGNIAIAQSRKQQHSCNAGKTCDGCSCVNNKPLINIIRNYDRITVDKIKHAGGEQYLDCEIDCIIAYRENKFGIEITLPTSQATNTANNKINHTDTDISKLPDGTFFYVNNGAWQGYITTENNTKVCYAGATKKNPTKEYVNRFILNDEYYLNINILD